MLYVTVIAEPNLGGVVNVILPTLLVYPLVTSLTLVNAYSLLNSSTPVTTTLVLVVFLSIGHFRSKLNLLPVPTNVSVVANVVM